VKIRVKMNQRVPRAMRDAAADALSDILEDALRESNAVAPIEEGTLIRSGFTEVDRQALKGQVAYDTPYAVYQHEDPTLKHDEGRKDHFLSDTVEENRKRYVEYIQDKVRGSVE
jgi:hypothetical protein